MFYLVIVICVCVNQGLNLTKPKYSLGPANVCGLPEATNSSETAHSAEKYVHILYLPRKCTVLKQKQFKKHENNSPQAPNKSHIGQQCSDNSFKAENSHFHHIFNLKLREMDFWCLFSKYLATLNVGLYQVFGEKKAVPL